jgi:hypothetical protein
MKGAIMYTKKVVKLTVAMLIVFCSTLCTAVEFENHAASWVSMKIGSPENPNLMIFVLESGEPFKQDYLPPITVLRVKYHDNTTQYQFNRKDAPKETLKIIEQDGKAEIPLLKAYKISPEAESLSVSDAQELKRKAYSESKEAAKS